MEQSRIYSVKVLLMKNSDVVEIRRFAMAGSTVQSYVTFAEKISLHFAELQGKLFKIYWKDDEDDFIQISTNEELVMAVDAMQSDVKKFYVKVKSVSQEEHVGEMLHPWVTCDGCNGNVAGFRYKCTICRNYDLCKNCENAAVHADHPMLRIPSPFTFDHRDLHKVLRLFSYLSIPTKMEGGRHSHHHRRRHSHDNSSPESCKKKRKSEKHESGQETEDSEEGCHKKHSSKKWKKMNKCAYSQLMNDFFSYFDPSQFSTEETGKRTCGGATGTVESSNMQYLKTIGKVITNLLDPLGVDVDFEVRPRNEDLKENEKDKKSSGTAGPSVSSSSQQKEVRFASHTVDTTETMKDKIEEITKILADQKMNVPRENDGWVDFEELKRDSEEIEQSSSSGAVPKENQSKIQNATVETDNKSNNISSGEETQNLYPTLNQQNLPKKHQETLLKMLAMGFKNEEQLTDLLKAKNWDIKEVLEALFSSNE